MQSLEDQHPRTYKMEEVMRGKEDRDLAVGQRDSFNVAYIVDDIISQKFKLTSFAISAQALLSLHMPSHHSPVRIFRMPR